MRLGWTSVAVAMDCRTCHVLRRLHGVIVAVVEVVAVAAAVVVDGCTPPPPWSP